MKLITAGHKKEQGLYLSFIPEEKAQVAQYGSVNGALAAVWRFSSEFSKELKENTIRDWVKTYQKEL